MKYFLKNIVLIFSFLIIFTSCKKNNPSINFDDITISEEDIGITENTEIKSINFFKAEGFLFPGSFYSYS